MSLSTTIDYKTLFEVWSSTSTNYTHLRVFGCPTYVYINDDKLEPMVKKCIFREYASKVRGYRLW